MDPAAEEPLTELFREVTGEPGDWDAVAYATKHQVLREVLAADLERLTQRFVAVSEARRRYRDLTRYDLREALREALACFPVYRTYVDEEGQPAAADRDVIAGVLARSRERRPDLDPVAFDCWRARSWARLTGAAETELRMRFQQPTGPVMAKAVEDTAFYAWPRFVALNEVGGDPGRFGAEPAEVHARRRRPERRPPGRA